ncbi:MAG: hypothetical protein B7Z08_04015 [Sphingomonadales bacterium 32-68-7]|nr:MAG: hypothetical protein B7Z33_13800 [Sphingomonadales bacterium 12-68-11]OYX09702.1 MAG: hypothetical protein B7Z08_04015 [Sphingomonadales bacterium 32-68-7]
MASVAAVSSVSAGAQSQAPGAGTCYIELQKLMSENGIADLGTAIRELDTRLRPQVEEVGRLKRLVETLEGQQQQAMGTTPVTDGDISRSLRTVAMPVTASEQAQEPRELAHLTMDLRRANADLQAKRDALKLAYTEQMRAIVGPVQAQIGERAQAFGTERGCRGLKMARLPEVAGLQSAGARDITGDFVSWYAVNKS